MTDRFHPADDRLIALYFGDEGSGADERRAVRQHLHGCETCTWRYTELTAPLERLRQDAAGEADEVFTPGASRRAACEDSRSSRRGGRRAPRHSVPGGASARTDRSIVRRPMVRWVAAAAAAGLLIGVVAGRLLDNGGGTAVATQQRARVVAALPATSVVSDSPVSTLGRENDEAMLSEIDQAVFNQRIAALSALDQMTPHVRPETVLARSIR